MKNRSAIKVLIPYLAGIILADKFHVNITFLWIMSAICLFAIFYAYKERWFTISSVILAVCLLFLGFIRYEISMTPPQNLDRVSYQLVKVLDGKVIKSQKERSGGSSLLIDGEAFLIKDSSISMKGKISIRSWDDDAFANEFGYGDVVSIGGLLFSVRQEFQTELNKKILSDKLRQEFTDNKITLSQNAKVLIEKIGDTWQIKDKQQVYIIIKKEDKLNIYPDVKLNQPRATRNPDAFDYRKYLHRQGIFATMTVNDVSEVQKIGSGGFFYLRLIRNLRDRIEYVISEITNDSDVESILKGVVLGENGEMSSELYDAFRKTSTTHILVVSGVNFSILAVWTYWLFNLIRKGILRIGIKKRFLENDLILYIPVFIIIVIYAFIAGMEFSVLRAFIFIFLFIVAIILSRDRDLFNILGVSAFCILIISPGAFWDAGFQLTFAAVTSITYFNPYWEKLLVKLKGKNLHQQALYRILQGIAVSISAQFGAGLIIAYTFGTFSIFGTIVNPIVAPLVFVITPIGFVSCIIGLAYLPIASLIGWLGNILISMLRDIVLWFAGISPLVYVKDFSLMHIIIITSFVIFAVNLPALLRKKFIFGINLGFQTDLDSNNISQSMRWEFDNKRISLSQNAKALIKKIGKRWLITNNSPENDKTQHAYHIIKENGKLNVYENRQTVLIYGLAVLTVFFWGMAMMYGGHVAKITYLDVGEGDSIYAEMPDNYKILIDGGSYREGYSLGERVVAPFLRREGVGNLDLMVSTHPDNDHAGGLSYLVDNPEIDFSINKVITGSYGITSPTFKELLKRLENKNIEHYDAKPEIIYENENMKIEVLSDQYHGVSKNEDLRMNNNSVVLKLTYKEASFLFTGDIEKDAERQLINSGRDVKATVLKVAHHGSVSSSSYEFIRAVQPSVAVISVGYNNFYKHPSPKVLARYDRSGVKIYRTDKQGAVTIITDGRYGWIKTMSK